MFQEEKRVDEREKGREREREKWNNRGKREMEMGESKKAGK